MLFTLVAICMLVVLTVGKVVKDPIIRWQNRIYAIHNKADLPSATVYGMRGIAKVDSEYSRMTRLKKLRNTKCDNKYLRQCLSRVCGSVG